MFQKNTISPWDASFVKNKQTITIKFKIYFYIMDVKIKIKLLN